MMSFKMIIRAANSVAGGWVWPKNQTHSNLYGCPCYLQDWGRSIQKMRVLEWSQQISNFKSMQIREVNSTVWGWIYFKFKLIQAFMVVLVTCKNEEDPIKIEGAKVVTTILHYPSIFKMLKAS